MTLRASYRVLLPLLFFASILQACLWDRDTIIDELQTRASQYDLVMGQFPSHGDVYYEQRIRQLKAKALLSIEEQNDLAVAYTRTKQYTKGLALLNGILEQQPNDYASLSNIGVTYKKMGDYKNAASYMEKALKIKPEGHMGLGNWYLKRLQWSAKYQTPSKLTPDVNFLGEKYTDIELRYFERYKVTKERKTRANLITKLLKNDRHFADAYVVMGDFLLQNADLNIAMRCYLHAQHLEHPNKAMIQHRIESIIIHWKMLSPNTKNRTQIIATEFSKQKSIFLSELKQTSQWLVDFHTTEASLVRKGQHPSFDKTSESLKTKRFRPLAKKNTSKIDLRKR